MMQHTKFKIQNHQLFKNENALQEYIDYMIKNGCLYIRMILVKN